MSDKDAVDDVMERLEWADDRDGKPYSRVRSMTRRTALSGGAAGLATAILAACGGDKNTTTTSTAASSGGSPASGIFKSGQKYKFVFVNHVTTNPFFVPTKYGA